jgi:hypothetical protein
MGVLFSLPGFVADNCGGVWRTPAADHACVCRARIIGMKTIPGRTFHSTI